jgi:hypothetical protein
MIKRENDFDTGFVNAMILCLPFWAFIALAVLL